MERTEESRRRLEQEFWSALDRRPDGKEPKASRTAGLEQKMERQTARMLGDKLSSIAYSIFRLTGKQWETLREAGMTPEQEDLLGRLDYRVKATDEYQANNMLDAIASVPESVEGWRGWWTENAWLMPRLWSAKHGERDETLRKLDGAIAVIAKAAGGSIPAPAEAAVTPSPPEKLSEALKRAYDVMRLAESLGISAGESGYGDLSPETMSREMEERGIRCEPDIGTLLPPEEVRNSPGWPGPDGFECDYETNLWWRRDITPPGGKQYTIRSGYEAMPVKEISEPEAQLIGLTTPKPPYGRPDGLGALALHNGLTRNQARRRLEGEAAAGGETPPPCPMAGECQSLCGKAHREGHIRFPPTENGGYEECDYYRFLATHGGGPLREKMAEAERDRILRERGKTRRRREPDPEEEGLEEPEAQPESSGRKAKPDRAQQSRLSF